VPTEDPKKKANALIDALPGNSPVSKAAILSATAGLSAAAISNELYVVNEETVVAISLLTIFWAVGKYAGPAWASYAQQQVDKISGILNAARADHTAAVKQRIESVQDLGSVVDITKTLFEVSKVGHDHFRATSDIRLAELG
jgi:F-type H+-transporting ATPase subunit b